MKKDRLKNIFIPRPENNHAPHLLREAGVVVVVLLALVIFSASVWYARLLVRNADLVAAIFPAVLVDLANTDRAENGIASLAVSPTLERVAALKARDMAEHGYFAHTSPAGLSPWHWFIEAGYQFINAGENLAVNFSDSDEVERAWMNSPGHRANILNGAFTEIGIAAAEGVYEGRKTTFVVQVFGRPAPVAAPIPAVADASITIEPPVPVPEESLEVVVETPTFVAVSVPDTTAVPDNDSESLALVGNAVEGAKATGLVSAVGATLWQRLAGRPALLAQWLYLALALLIALVLTATVVIEIEKQHPRHIFYGLALLTLLLALVYLNGTYLFRGVFVL